MYPSVTSSLRWDLSV
jgi:hypothetical protein